MSITQYYPKSVLILASTFPRWDGDCVPPFVFELSKQYVGKVNVIVLAPYSGGSKKYEMMDGMTVHRFNYWPFSKKLADGAILPNLKTNKLFWLQVPFFMLCELIAIRRMIKKYNPDVIHAHWIIPQGINAVIIKKCTRWQGQIVCTTHGGDIFGLQFLTRLKKWVVSNCSAITVVSEAIKEKVEDFGLTVPVELIPMGVDKHKFSPTKRDDAFREKFAINGAFLLFVGRLSEKKGVEYLVKAMPAVLAKFPDAKLVIVGHGELADTLKHLVAQELHLSCSIIFAGGIANHELPALYATADIFIGPSIVARDGDREGFPVSFMEAMACGTPLIISDIQIFSNLQHEQNAMKAREKDSESIAQNIIRLLDDQSLRQRIIDNNSVLVANTYSLDVVGKKYMNILV